jgi:hypothetical protein
MGDYNTLTKTQAKLNITKDEKTYTTLKAAWLSTTNQVSHPKISISECEPFFKRNSKFFKGFHLFSFKMILFEFIFNLKCVYKVKLFILAFKSHSFEL